MLKSPFIVLGKEINFIHLKSASSKKIGLLNHCSLSEGEGVLYTNKKLFHTFGMKFSIVVIALDRSQELICPPVVVSPGHIFIVPTSSCYILETQEKSDPLPL
jgi:hypothetical protein